MCQDTFTPTLQKASTVQKWRYFLQKQRVTARVAGVIIIKEIKVGHARNLSLTMWNAFLTGVNVQLVFVQFYVQGAPPPTHPPTPTPIFVFCFLFLFKISNKDLYKCKNSVSFSSNISGQWISSFAMIKPRCFHFLVRAFCCLFPGMLSTVPENRFLFGENIKERIL